MRLSNKLRRELEARLSAIESERDVDPAYRDLPAIDEWALKLLVAAAIAAIFFL